MSSPPGNIARTGGIAMMLRRQLWMQILVALALGIGLGLLLSPDMHSPIALSIGSAETLGEWLRLPGGVFLNLIQMIVVPLIVSSIALGLISAGNPAFLKRVASRFLPYFFMTSIVSVTIGATLALWVQPGAYVALPERSGSAAPPPSAEAAPALEESGRGWVSQLPDLIPSNLTAAGLDQNMLQIVIASIFLGVAIIVLDRATMRPVIELMQAAQAIALKVVSWSMLLAPIAVFGLLADFVMRAGLDALIGMSAYILTVIAGLGLLLCVYLLIVGLIGRVAPLHFARQVVDAQLLAFATSSSAATMPLSLRIATDRLQVRPAIARFIVPLGATINMDGTALYQVVAAIFMAQIYGVDIEMAAFALLMVTVIGASIGSPSTPGVGIVILSGILASIGIPPEGVAILLGVDRLLDMCRTSVNVTGDLAACVVMDRWLEHTPEPNEDI